MDATPIDPTAKVPPKYPPFTSLPEDEQRRLCAKHSRISAQNTGFARLAVVLYDHMTPAGHRVYNEFMRQQQQQQDELFERIFAGAITLTITSLPSTAHAAQPVDPGTRT